MYCRYKIFMNNSKCNLLKLFVKTYKKPPKNIKKKSSKKQPYVKLNYKLTYMSIKSFNL